MSSIKKNHVLSNAMLAMITAMLIVNLPTIAIADTLFDVGGINCEGNRFGSSNTPHGEVVVTRVAGNQLIVNVNLQNGEPNQTYSIEIFEAAPSSPGCVDNYADTGVRITSDSQGNGQAVIQFTLPYTFFSSGLNPIGDGLGSESIIVVLDDSLSTGPGDRFSTDPIPINKCQSVTLSTNTTSAQSVVLNWEDYSSNETGFSIDRKVGSGAGGYQQIATVGANVTTYKSTDLDPETIYTFQVRTLCSDGSFSYSNESISQTPTAIISIIDANMSSNENLQIGMSHNLSDVNDEYPINLNMTINGKAVTLFFDLTGGEYAIHAIDVNLRESGVSRFISNQQFEVIASATLNNGLSVEGRGVAAILLPVVLVPGIMSGMGGDNTFSKLEEYLKIRSYDTLLYGEGYHLRGESSYPTLFTLSYNTDNSVLVNGALELANLVDEIRNLTYAGKIKLIGYSKGGLVARQFVINYPHLVNHLFMCATPNTGSLWAWRFSQLNVSWPELWPTWPSYRKAPTQSFMYLPNSQLVALNRIRLPGGIRYTNIYSDTFVGGTLSTEYTYTQQKLPPQTQYTSGDVVVPGFSARGLIINTNPGPGYSITGTIPAFQITPPLEEVRVDGSHIGYLDILDVQSAIFERLFQDIQ